MSKPSPTQGRPISGEAATVWTRRTFLAGLVAAGGTATWRFLLQPLVFGNSRPNLESLLLESVRRLPIPVGRGQEFLAQRPGTSQILLIQHLTSRIRKSVPIHPSNENQLFRVFSQLVREDARAKRFVSGDSWKLTETETTLAALHCLLETSSKATSDAILPVPLQLYRVSNWGPQSTGAGISFNRQPDGSSALWFQAEGVPLASTVWLGKIPLKTHVAPTLITADLPSRRAGMILAHPGTYPVQLMAEGGEGAQLIGFLHVFPSDPAQPFESEPLDFANSFRTGQIVQVLDWGPQETSVGESFNVQQDGRSGIWVRYQGELPAGSFLSLAGFPLLTTAGHQGVFTAGAVPALTSRLTVISGSLPLDLVEPASRLVQRVGAFKVHWEA